MSNHSNNNGWDEWKNHVLEEQKRQGKVLDQLHNKLDNFKVRVSTDMGQIKTEVRIKSGVWGAIAGMIPILLAMVYLYLSKH